MMDLLFGVAAKVTKARRMERCRGACCLLAIHRGSQNRLLEPAEHQNTTGKRAKISGKTTMPKLQRVKWPLFQ